jgi:hypothetical protein
VSPAISPHDVWDLDAVSPTVLTPVKNNAGKTGYLCVHDAKDCSLICVSEPLVALKNERMFATAEGVVIRPGPNGGVSASPLAVEPRQGLACALTTKMSCVYVKGLVAYLADTN